MTKEEMIKLLLEIKKIADDVHYYNDGEYNCEYISELISEKLELGKKKGGKKDVKIHSTL